MNKAQRDMIDYMQEVVNQEDCYFFEAWKAVEQYVLDALEYTPDSPIQSPDER